MPKDQIENSLYTQARAGRKEQGKEWIWLPDGEAPKILKPKVKNVILILEIKWR